MKVCLFANTLSYPEGGGHLWVYLNWALGLRSLGCQVIWLEDTDPRVRADAARVLWLLSKTDRPVVAALLAGVRSTDAALRSSVLSRLGSRPTRSRA